MHAFTRENELKALIGIDEKLKHATYARLVRAGKLGDIHCVLRDQWGQNVNSDPQVARAISEIQSAIDLGYVSDLEGFEYMIFNQVLGKAMAYQRS